jgi:hypothetical protein
LATAGPSRSRGSYSWCGAARPMATRGRHSSRPWRQHLARGSKQPQLNFS